jgi:hypothetical protein
VEDVISGRAEGAGEALGAYGGRALTKGRPGGNEPIGNFAERSPALRSSAASRKAARKRPYASRRPSRIALLAAWNRGADDFLVLLG